MIDAMKTSSSLKKKSLYRELTLGLITLVSTAAIIVNLTSYVYLSYQAERLYDHKTVEYSGYLRKALELPLWNVDNELVGQIAGAFCANIEIASLIVRDELEQPIYRKVKSIEQLPTKKIIIKHNDQKIGSVELGLNTAIYQERNQQLMLAGLVMMVLIIIVLLIATRWLLQNLLKKPISALIGATCNVTEEKYRQNNLSIAYTEFSPILSSFRDMSKAIAMREDSLRHINEQLAAEIEERKQAEQQLRHYKDHLEEQIQERTVELSLSRDAAEAANKAKSIFLANMSHELRTPLNAILGFSNIMRKEPLLPDSLRENLDIINRSGEHLLTLINDVLEMAKIEAGRVLLENKAFDLGNMVRDVIDMMQIRATEKKLHLLLDQSSDFPRYITGDEAKLRQIIVNLLGNAIKFTLHGGVTLRLGNRKNSVSHLIIEVEDTGIGINAENQQRIFEPFVQAGKHTANSQGTGLGLSITRQFVQLMAGTIEVNSTPDVGTLFRVELPLSPANVSDISTSQYIEYGGDVIGLAPGQPKYRILIAEDQKENQLLLTKLMDTLGLSCKIAENGEQSVQLFQSWQPHLIWMDRRMPLMDGMESTHRIRQLPNGKQVKIVAVTASAFAEQRTEMLAAGMDDFIRKPYRASEIYDCLSRQLNLEYIYANTLPAVDTQITLASEMLVTLPSELRSKLYNALESLETELIEEVIAQIALQNPALSKQLTKLANNYDYLTILTALENLENLENQDLK